MTQEESELLSNCLSTEVYDIAEFEQAKKILDKYGQEMDLSEFRFNIDFHEEFLKVNSLPEHEKKVIFDVLRSLEGSSPELVKIVDQFLNEKYKDMDLPVYRRYLELHKKFVSED